MKDIFDFYKALLATGWMVADGEGFVSNIKTDGREPTILDGKRLVLPNDIQTRSPDVQNRVYFHPLNESALKGESIVVQRLRRAYSAALNYKMAMTLASLLETAASHAQHASLSPEQSEILSPLKDANADTVVNFLTIVRKATEQFGAEASLIKIYLKRNGTVHGKSYGRAAIVNFPVYEELIKEDEEKVLGVKLSKKDHATLKALFEYTMPGIKEGDYSQGSNSDVAPFLDALLKAVAKIGGNLNHYSKLYGFDKEDDAASLPLDWYEDAQNLEQYLPQIRTIPALYGADGGQPRVIDTISQQQAVAAPQHQASVVRPGTPYVAPAPAPTTTFGSSTGSVSMQDLLAQRSLNAAQPQNQVPMHQNHLPPTPPLSTSRGLNFGALMMSRGMQPQVQQAPLQQGWGAPQQPQYNQINYGPGV